MEELVKKVVNLGIGTGIVLEQNLSGVRETAERSLADMIAKGEAANDERTTQIRKAVDDVLDTLKTYETKALELKTKVTDSVKGFEPAKLFRKGSSETAAAAG